jgi:hypothetical protein
MAAESRIGPVAEEIFKMVCRRSTVFTSNSSIREKGRDSMQRTLGVLSTLAVSAALMSMAPAVRSQILASGSVDFEANGATFFGAPYMANRKTTHVQKLADGTTITHVVLGKEARDSEGRTYSERRVGDTGDGDESHVTVHFFIRDPVARTSTSWDSRSKFATVFHAPAPGSVRFGSAPAPAPPEAAVGGGAPAQAGPAHAPVGAPGAMPPIRMVDTRPNAVESLGTKTIEGVTVEGKRMTRIIPAGRQGNDQPITIIEERWHSPELKITVLQIRDDPRTGTTTMELSDIVPGEPDAALFQVPEGYEIRERTPGQVD